MKEQSSPTQGYSTASPLEVNARSFDLDDLENTARARFSVDTDHSISPTPLHEVHPTSSRKLYRRILKIFGLILLWYTFSLLLSLYNKWMFAPSHLNFPFPLFVTALHMVMQFFLSGIVLWLFPRFRPNREDFLTPREYAYVFS
jgi:hypothetical protein